MLPPVPSSDILWDPQGQLCHQISLANTPLPATAPSLRVAKPPWLHTGDACPCPCHHPCPLPGSPSTDTVPVFPAVPNSPEPVSSAETPPHPFTSARGTLDPRVSVLLTRGCTHSTPEPPGELSLLQPREAPGRSLIVFGRCFCRVKGQDPPCSIMSPPAPPVQPQAEISISSSKKQSPCKPPSAPSRGLAAPAESQDLLCRVGPKPWQVSADPRSKGRSSVSAVPQAAGGNPTGWGGRVGIRPSVPLPDSPDRETL